MTKLYQPLSKTLAVLLLTLLTSVAWAQTQTVTGKVTSSDDGMPLPGVNIIEKGTTNGTATDSEGKYSLTVRENATLVFTFVGYATQEASANQSTVDIILQSDFTSLNEVVVVGYETIKKKDLTGSVAQVSAADLNKGVYTSPAQLIQGKIAGLAVVSASGAPGAENSIQIRGPGSLRSGSAPLIVVDGIQLDNNSAKPGVQLPGALGASPGIDPMSFINGADIERIDVLKDASATAIYGSRGANGVIMITTKKPARGEMAISFGASTGVSSISKKIDMLNADEYRAALESEGITGGDFGSEANAFDEIIRTGVVQNYNLSFAAGGEHSSHRVSIGYTDQEGIIKKSGMEKYNAMLNSHYAFLEDRIKLDVLLLGAQVNQQSAPIGNNSPTDGNLISQALQWNPTNPLREDGEYNQPQSNVEVNPLATLHAFDDDFYMTRLIASVAPTVRIAKGLDYKLQVAIDHTQGDRYIMQKKWLFVGGKPGLGEATYNTSKVTTKQFSHTLTYSKDLDALSFSALLGYEFQDSRVTGMRAGAVGFSADEIDFRHNFQDVLASNTYIVNIAPPDAKLQSYFGRVNVTYDDRFRVTATLRSDGSTKFGSGNKYGVFPAFGFAWTLSEEEFMPDLFDDFKLRLGWGKTGSQTFPSGLAPRTYGVLRGPQGPILDVLNDGNPNLKWETSVTTNVGFDIALLNSRVTASIDYFNKVTDDQLYNAEAPLPSAGGNRWVNLEDGQILNKGLELALNGYVIDKGDVSLSIGGNVTFLKNEFAPRGDVEDFVVDTGVLNGKGLSGETSQRTAKGHPINSFYLPVWLGFDENGESLYEDGFANIYPKKFVGSALPKMYYGMTVNLNVKKFDAALSLNGVSGNKIYNNTANAVLVKGNLGSRNISPDLVGNKESFANEPAPSTRYLENGGFLRLANVTLGYSPEIKFAAIKNFRVYFTAQNLFVITDYSGFDPEVNVDKSFNGFPSFGIDYTQYPKARTFTVGVNATF
ncbi:SusC/RagA family TonB-linked outer membrane protein [Pseudochryseolinea flava]|uniref:SusC/RagA family TonB-linked outer membrane protein n=1 Tax=Pseudochryseolinea flava TaxID=2059302 RepID=A0A364Y1N8_9BACT|nr:SusC/RagA family TonB-linked outer membrane protein [Pseudochryseolinea flava]RAW00624.1 SusC/RagA family TonB-linked outer membrane protein [Pseudochryseolinea flava]